MSLAVECHGLRPNFGFDGLDDAVLVPASIANHGNGPIATGAKDVAGRRIEGSGIHSFADRLLGENFTVLGIDDDQQLVSATHKETLVFRVDRQTDRGFSRGKRPVLQHFELVRVNLRQFTLVFDSYEQIACSIDGRRFRLAFQLDGADDLLLGRIDDSGRFVAAVECENALLLGS